MALRIGQPVRIVDGCKGDEQMLGAVLITDPADLVATVVSGPQEFTFSDPVWVQMEKRGYTRTIVGYMVETAASKKRVWGPPEWYAPIDDGAEKVEWTEELRLLCGLKEKKEEECNS